MKHSCARFERDSFRNGNRARFGSHHDQRFGTSDITSDITASNPANAGAASADGRKTNNRIANNGDRETASSATTSTRATGETALQALAAWRADVLLSDIGMPSMDGHELLARVRTLRLERGGQTPALALTAYASQEDGQRALDCGFQKHLAKPFAPHGLAAIVAALLENAAPDE